MKRTIVIPSKPLARPPAAEREPRERRRLGIRYDTVTGDGVSGLR